MTSCFNNVLTAATFLAFLLCGCLVTDSRAETPGDIDDVAQRITRTTEQLQLLSAEINNAKAIKSSIKSALAKARSAGDEREHRASQLKLDIDKFDRQLLTLETEINKARAIRVSTRQSLSAVLRAAGQLGGHSTLRIVLQQKKPAEAARLQAYSSYLMEAQRELINAQTAILQELKSAEMALKKDRNWLNYLRSKVDRQRDEYAQLTREKSEKLAQIDQELTQKTQSVAQLSKDQTRLQSLLNELQSAPGNASDYFESLKGNIALPVTDGTLSARFGDQKDVEKLRWKGLFIQARAGSKVNALADGEVLYGDWLQGFGMLVILDHGDGYMSLYGGNRKILIQPGDWVESGSTIATVGDSGGQNTSGLYLEIRHNAKAVDPEAWIRFENS